jgi:hypothetical protein
MLIADHFDHPKVNENIIMPQTTIINNSLAVGDIVVFEVSGIKKSASNQTHQTVRGQVLSFGDERIEVDNFNRKNELKARKDKQGRARRQYRFDQILGGRNNIRIIHHG